MLQTHEDLPGDTGDVALRAEAIVEPAVWIPDFPGDEPDMEYAMVDATIVKVHRHGQGAKGGLRARPSASPRAA